MAVKRKNTFKRKYESRKGIKPKPVRLMCHANTCVPHQIRDE